MIRPTRRAVILFAAGLPASLIVVIVAPSLWGLCAAYGFAIFFAMMADALLALPSKAIRIDFDAPGKIYIGEKESITAAFDPPRYRRSCPVELLLEQRGELERQRPCHRPAAARREGGGRHSGRANPPRPCASRLALAALAGALVSGSVAAAGEDWPDDRGRAECERVRGNSVLRLISQEAIYGEKVHERGEGSEFEALREYLPGHDIRFIDWKHSAQAPQALVQGIPNRAQSSDHPGLRYRIPDAGAGWGHSAPRPCHQRRAGAGLGWLQSGDLVGDLRVRREGTPISRPRARVRRLSAASSAERRRSTIITRRRISRSAWPS